MGLFDFFKKRNQGQDTDKSVIPELSEQPIKPITLQSTNKAQQDPEINTNHYIDDREDGSEEQFNFIFKYAEYVVRFLGMMFQNVTAPVAAYEKLGGELIGYLFIGGDNSYSLTAKEVVERMEIEFKKRTDAQQIKSWIILYHSAFQKDGNHQIAQNASAMHAITVKYCIGNKVNFLAIPYTRNEDEITFKGFDGFSRRQNEAILSTNLENNKDYFQEKIEMKAEILENEAGILIKKVNNGSLGDMWGGILGFETHSRSRQLMIEYMAATFMGDYLKHTTSEVFVYEMSYGDVIFRGLKTTNDSWRTVVPNVKATKAIDVVNKQINEWENANDMEAVIKGGGRESFAVTYFATDYAVNKNIYYKQPKLNILFSAILFVLAESEMRSENSGLDITLSEEFAGYMPHKELAEFGCFEFIGIIEDFYKNDVLEHGSAKGYIIAMKLINHNEVDFFTIPMFINAENMRFTELRIGMKVSGVFQLLGEIQH